MADCIRQTIIDPALVYPWCLISINSSLKELAGDSSSLPPPFSFAPVFLWICQEWEIYDDPRKILICCWDAEPARGGHGSGLVVYVPYTGRGQGLSDGGSTVEQRGHVIKLPVDPWGQPGTRGSNPGAALRDVARPGPVAVTRPNSSSAKVG